MSAQVYLVGAGPGDPGLITLRGVQCLARADIVLYDYLVNPAILRHARVGAELVCLGRHGRDRIWPQSEINARMVAEAQAGRTVVRLKAGDPVVFARAVEEITALEAARIVYEIVPGITAALAVGSSAGIPLTQGENASAVALVTGHERPGKPSTLDYQALAQFPGTLVFYMGVTTAEAWSVQLMAAGKPADTPAAIVRRCSWPDQQSIACTLGTVAEAIRTRQLRPPALVVVGAVAAEAERHGWFIERPLFGTRVLVTRADHQAQELVDLLAEQGAETFVQPAIHIGPPADWQPVDQALSRLDAFDWIVFSSANGVRAFCEQLLASRDLRALAGAKLAAIGSATAAELARFHLRCDLVPNEFRAESLADALAPHAADSRMLLVRASRGREVLAERLSKAGATVEQIVVYQSQDVEEPDTTIAELLAGGKIDWITVTSSAIARSLVRLFGESLRKARLASISPVTTATLAELGLPVAAEAQEFTMAGVVESLLAAAAGDDR